MTGCRSPASLSSLASRLSLKALRRYSRDQVVLPLARAIAPPEGFVVRRYAAIEAVSTTIHGDQADFLAILGAYNSLYGWAKRNDRTPSEPPPEVRLDDAGTAFEILLPLA